MIAVLAVPETRNGRAELQLASTSMTNESRGTERGQDADLIPCLANEYLAEPVRSGDSRASDTQGMHERRIDDGTEQVTRNESF